MSKNVAVFVDVANIFYAAKAAGVDIDYVTLLKASSAGRDLVRAYAYTGLDPENENQRNFHDFLRRHGYKVVSKDIRKYGDGKVKANLDIELVVDMMKTARNLDIAIVVSGDGDFAPAIRAVQEQGVRVEVVSFRGNTSSDLMDVADQFTDITQIAKVEKGSSRSGRRVADDDQDLSMTEVPDKQSEGTGERSRGRGRTRRTTSAGTGTGSSSRGRTRVAAVSPSDEAGDAPLVVLPGEKLSRAAAASVAPENGVDAEPLEADDELDIAAEGGDEGLTEDGRRRRRRRGGRGRGRGRAREGAESSEGEAAERAVASEPFDDDADEDDIQPAAPSRRQGSTFGSVWDSQIGVPAAARAGESSVLDDEDLDEPAVPEYLLAERRQRDGRGGRGGAGGRGGRGGAYAAALERERFGGGRGSTPSRYAEPAPRDRGGYGRDDRRDRGDRGDRGRPERRDRGGFQNVNVPRPAPRGSGDEPWSEVPPEIEAMLRAQLGSRPAAPAPRREEAPAPEAVSVTPAAEAEAEEATTTRRRGGRTRATAAETATAAEGPATTRKAPARRTRAAAETTDVADASAAVAPKARRSTTTRSTTTRTSTRSKAVAADAEAGASADAPVEAAPKRRTTRKKAEPAA